MKTPFTSKLIATALATLHFASIAVAGVGATQKDDDSAEVDLISGLIALTGQKLTQDTYRNEALPLIHQYEISNPNDEGRSERFTQAMLDLKLVTPAQADNIRTEIDASVGAMLKANPNMSEVERRQLVLDATSAHINRAYMGAQYSEAGCLWLGIGGGLVLAGSILADVYASTLTHTSTSTVSSGTSQGSGTLSSSTNGSSSNTTTTTVSGTSSTTSSSYTANETQQKMIYAVAGIGYGIAATVAIIMMFADGPCN